MAKTRQLVIVGAGETANLAYEYFTYDSEYEAVAFAVDPEYVGEGKFLDLPLVAIDKMGELYPPEKVEAFVAFGSGELNYQRDRMCARVKAMGYRFASYVSSRAFVWRNVKIGENCFILEDNTLQPFTEVGDDVVMWSGNHLGHQSKIGSHCFVTSHVVISGFCSVGEHTFIGVNTSVADHTVIGADNFIAMGSAISGKTGDNEVWRGSPAKKQALPAKIFCGVSGNEK